MLDAKDLSAPLGTKHCSSSNAKIPAGFASMSTMLWPTDTGETTKYTNLQKATLEQMGTRYFTPAQGHGNRPVQP